jgi:NADH-quinone oxidoreductase subunit J
MTLGFWLLQWPRMGSWPADGLFFVLAAVTVISAVCAVTFRNPVYCAVWFGLSLLGTASLFLFIGAQFLAVATVAVYAGAILVMFLFVLMLAQPKDRAAYDRSSWEAPLAAAVGVCMVGTLSAAIGGVLTASNPPPVPPTESALAAGVLAPQHVARFGQELFGARLIEVEIAGVLLFAALVGAAVIVGSGKAEGGRHKAEDC